MQAIPENWATYWRNPDCIVDVLLRVVFDESLGIIKEFKSADVSRCNLEAQISPDFSIGNACSAHLSFEVINATYYSASFQKGQRIDFSVRLKLGENVTDYVNQGIFYISEVSPAENGALSISAYDEMLSFENMFISDNVTVQPETNFSDVLDFYAANNSINVDFSQLLNEYVYKLPRKRFYGNDRYDITLGQIKVPKEAICLDLRSMLGSVAAMAGGNVFITKDNKAALKRPDVNSTYHYVPDSLEGMTDAYIVRLSSAQNITGDSQYVYATGLRMGKMLTGTGWLMETHIADDFGITPYELCDIADNLPQRSTYRKKSVRAKSVEAVGASFNPVLDLGDEIYVSLGKPYETSPGHMTTVHQTVYVGYFSVAYDGDCYGTVGNNVKSEDVQFSEYLAYYVTTSREGWFDAFGDQDGIIDGDNDNLFVTAATDNQNLEPEIIGKNTFILKCDVLSSGYGLAIARFTGAEHIEGTITYRYAGATLSATVDANLRQSICPMYEYTHKYDGGSYHNVGTAYLIYDNKYTFPDNLVAEVWDGNVESWTISSNIYFKKPNSQADGYEVLAEYGSDFQFAEEMQPTASEITQVKYGGTGQTGVISTSTISDVITAASGVTIGIARYSVWGKLATFYIRATPSAAKSGTWDVGTLPEGKRPADEAAFITGNEAVIGYITTAGVVKVVGSVSANTNVYLKATYLLA